MEFKGRTPIIKRSYKNQSCPKNYKSGKNKLNLPQINQYTNQQRNYHFNNFNNSNILPNLFPKDRPQIKFINSFSDARLPDEFYDQSYDNPQNK